LSGTWLVAGGTIAVWAVAVVEDVLVSWATRVGVVEVGVAAA
jgi:hypothetical protein